MIFYFHDVPDEVRSQPLPFEELNLLQKTSGIASDVMMRQYQWGPFSFLPSSAFCVALLNDWFLFEVIYV